MCRHLFFEVWSIFRNAVIREDIIVNLNRHPHTLEELHIFSVMAENVGRFVAVQRSCRFMHLEKGQKAYNSIFFPPFKRKEKKC